MYLEKDHCSLCSCAVSHKLHKVKTTSKHTKCHIFTMHTPAFKHSHFYLNTLHFTPVTYEHILPVPSHYRLPVWLLVCLYHIGFGLWQAKLHRRHGNRKTRNDLFHKCFTARKTQYWNSIHRKQEFWWAKCTETFQLNVRSAWCIEFFLVFVVFFLYLLTFFLYDIFLWSPFTQNEK